MKHRVLLLNSTCLDIVDAHRDWLSAVDVDVVANEAHRNISAEDLEVVVRDFDGVVGPSHPSVSPEMMRRSPRLRVISLASSGFDSLDVSAATTEGIVVTNARVPAGAEVVADMAWGLLLAVARQVPQHDRNIRAGNHHRGIGMSPWRRSLGIVGLGSIGRAVARRAVGFEMRILASEPHPDLEFAARHGIELVCLDGLLSSSDFVSLHARLNDATWGMIGAEELSQMKPTAFLINTARRELVDESALIRALKDGRLAGAGLDDPPTAADSPLLSMDNVVMTPHLGNRADVGVNAVFRCAVQNAADVLAGRRCESVVNPDVYTRGLRSAYPSAPAKY